MSPSASEFGVYSASRAFTVRNRVSTKRDFRNLKEQLPEKVPFRFFQIGVPTSFLGITKAVELQG
jgi:hypothetical protein